MVKFPGETAIYVFYDIEDDRLRGQVAETCKDYGLTRIQLSGFFGYLTKSKREELFLKFTHILKDQKGKILIQPVCDRDLKVKLEFVHE